MTPAGFLKNKWPRVHDYVVEECLELHVSDVLAVSPPTWQRQLVRRWQPDPRHAPRLWLVLAPAGYAERWRFCCPTCRRHCEALFVAPGAMQTDLRCRTCWSLIYASQRYGERHPLRKTVTYRKRVTVRKEVMRQQRRQHRLMQKQRRQWDALASSRKHQDAPGSADAWRYVAGLIAQGKGLVIRVE